MEERIKCGGLQNCPFHPPTVFIYVYVCVCKARLGVCRSLLHPPTVYMYVCACVKCLEPACWSFPLTIQCMNVYLSVWVSVYMYIVVCMKLLDSVFCFIHCSRGEKSAE